MSAGRSIAICVALVFLGACRDPGPGEEGAVDLLEDVAPPLQTEFKEPLIGGVTGFPFKYHVSVDSVELRKDGSKARQVGIEFFGSNVVSVDDALRDELEKGGLNRYERRRSGDAIRNVYINEEGVSVLVWVRASAPPGEKFRLQHPSAAGTVYMAWDLSPDS